MSDFDKLLESITEWNKPYEKYCSVDKDGNGIKTLVPLVQVAEHLDAITERVRRLLPLLLAGQACRNNLEAEGFHGCGIAAWDAAKQAALGEAK
jgi:hypothetical protein